MDLRPRNGVLVGYWSCKFPICVVIIPQNDGDVSLYGANVWLGLWRDQVLGEYIYDDILNLIHPTHALEMSLADDTISDTTINALKRRINTLQEIVCREKEIDIPTTVPV